MTISASSLGKDYSKLKHDEFFKLNKKQLIEASEQGYASAQLILGYYYGEVWNPANLSKALDLFVKSAKQGNKSAAFWAANYYWQGKGSAPNYQTACTYAAMNEGVQGDNSIPERLMATCYSNGWGVQHDLAKAEKIIGELINSGVDVHHMLAGVYKQQGKYLEAIAEYKQSSNYERGTWNKAINKLEVLSAQKAREIKERMVKLERKKRVELKKAENEKRKEMELLAKKTQDQQKREAEWAKKQSEFEAAKEKVLQGGLETKQVLGAMYFLGWGTAKDCEKAHGLLIEGAKQGSANAQYWLGEIYESGCDSIKKNAIQSFNWFYVCMGGKGTSAKCFSKAKGVAQRNPSYGKKLSKWKSRGMDFIKSFYGVEEYKERLEDNIAYAKRKKEEKENLKYVALTKLGEFRGIVSAVSVNCPSNLQAVESMLSRQMKRFEDAEYVESMGGSALPHYKTIIDLLTPNGNLYLQGLQQSGCY